VSSELEPYRGQQLAGKFSLEARGVLADARSGEGFHRADDGLIFVVTADLSVQA
jgi:hypothetical protein